MAKQTNLFGSVISPTPKRKCIKDSIDKFKESWKEAALWPKSACRDPAHAAALPTTWLELVQEPLEGMVCLLCQKHNKNTTPRSGKPVWSVEPCTLFRLQSIHRHCSSNMHKDAVRQELDSQRSESDGGVAAAFQHVWEAEEKAVSAAMSCVYFLAKEEIAHMTKYKPLLELLSFLGLPFLNNLHKGDNATSTSHRIIEEFLSVLGDSVRSSLVVKLQKSPCYGIICDETTDLSTSKQLIIYIKAITYDNNTPTTDTFFLAMRQLHEANADSVSQCLKDTLSEHGLQLSNCIGLGSDGASVMTGAHNGVSAQLKLMQPALISIHCVAHRLALAVIQAANKVGAVHKFKNYINSLFVYFHGSAKCQGRLAETFEVLENRPALKLRKPADTRWLACDEAVQIIKKSLQPLSIALQDLAAGDSSDATALGLSTLMSKYEFVAGVFFMSEILPILSRLSKTFQIENLDFGSIKPAIKRATDSIKTLKACSQSKTADWQKELFEWEQNTSSLTGQRDDVFLSKFCLPFIQSILDNLSARFPDDDMDILSAGEVFLPSSIPTDLTDCYSYGRDHINTLAKHYGCNIEETLSEWKEVLPTLKTKEKLREVLHFLVAFDDLYPNLSKIASSLLVIPVHSADCERGFSALGRIKTKLRSRLTNKYLNSLLMINLNGADLNKFDFHSALQTWASIRKRRVFTGKPHSSSSSMSTQT